MSIVTYPLNDVLYNAEDAEVFNSVRTSGVFAAKDNLDASVTGDREVTISPGLAWIKNTRFSGKSVAVLEPVSLQIDGAEASLYRIDRIVLRFSKAKNRTELAVKKGTPSLAPVAPEIEKTEDVYELGLYIVAVAAGTSVVTMNEIYDTRQDSDVCGIMASGADISHMIDNMMSDTSTNAVQNKIIKMYVDDADGKISTRIASLLRLVTEDIKNLEKLQDEVEKLKESGGTGGSGEKVPTKTSELTNDSGFITRLVKDLVNYYTTDQTYTKDEVNNLVGAIPKFSISVVTTLPSVGISETTVYLLKAGNVSGDLYTEYIFANGAWEVLGSQRVDLTGYATETWVNTQLSKYLLETDLTTAVNLALANAKASGEFDGADGMSPTISVKEHSITDGGGVSITVTKPDGTTSTARLYDGKDGDDGKNGTSVTVTKVTESTADGGSNIIEFSDGKSVTVKNGNKGSTGATGATGAAGKSAYAYAKDGGYTGTEAEFAEDTNPDNIKSDAEAFIVTELAKRGQLKPEFANSIDELNASGDTSKLYVLPDGYIYGFIKTTTTTEGESVPNFKNVMDDPNASIKTGVRYSQSGAASGTQWKPETGDTSIIIPMTSVKPTIRVRGAGNNAKYNNYIYVSYDGKELFPITPEYTRTVADNGDITITVNATLSTPKYATFAVASGFDADELIVTVNEEITYTTTEGGTVTTEQWANTGHAFVPADYEDRIIEVENKAEENADKISALEDEMNKPKSTGIITMFISPTGNDSNNGLTVSSPKKTVKACVEAGATRISAKRGIYTEKITLSNIDTLEIFPTDNDYTFDASVKRYPPIVFDTSHTIPISNLSAYNSIKKVAYAEPNEALTYVFTNGLYDRVYSTSHGYHAVLWAITGTIKNDFKLKPMATIAEVEATTNSFTWVNNVLYLNANFTGVTEIRVPTIYDNAITVFTANKVKLTDVEVRFAGRYSILIENCPDVSMDNCSVKYTSNGSGFDFKNVNGVLRNCYASRVHDGYGIGDYGHTIFIDCVAEWCFDDGMSHHRGCTGTVIGGRYEGNIKAGNCPAHGANVNIYGGLYKDNKTWGIAYWYENTYNPCTGMVQGATMVGNPKGLVVDAGSSVTAINCHYVGNTKDKEITGTLVEY
jgi:hypothetical protein